MKFFAILLCIIVYGSAASQTISSKTLRGILQAQDLRDAKALSTFLTNKNAAVRARAAFACGSVQDTVHIQRLIFLLLDRSADVRSAAAFGLGEMNLSVDSSQRSVISQALAHRLPLEWNAAVLQQVIEAMGKVGDKFSLSILVAAGENYSSSAANSDVALAVGRYAYRGIKSKIATAYALRILAPSFPGNSWKAAYAVMRISDASLFSPNESVIIQAASHPDPRVRMFVATALAKIISMPPALNAVLSLVLSDKDWRVRVNAIKSAGKSEFASYSRVLPILIRAVSDSNEHVSLTSSVTLGDMEMRRSSFATEGKKVFVEVMDDASLYSQRQKKEAAIALAKIFGSESFPVLKNQAGKNNLTTESYAAALAYVPTTEAVQELISMDRRDQPRLQRMILESLQISSTRVHKPSEVKEIAKPFFVSSLQSSDMAVLATAASALAESLYADEHSVAPLVATLIKLKSPSESEAMVAITQALGTLKAIAAVGPLESQLNDSDRTVALETAKALEKITGKPYIRLVKINSTPTYTNFDWKLLDWIERNPLLNVKTSRGSFTLKLMPDKSPFTCINIATLVGKKFYDGLLFHRVVPNFVIQGGDPRGDGWGGPGYAIRSEFSDERYEAGTVGIASSGKDTEGCQWFVTHSDTPHLDGRYTIIGRIISGMDVVNKIQVGDRIESMTFATGSARY